MLIEPALLLVYRCNTAAPSISVGKISLVSSQSSSPPPQATLLEFLCLISTAYHPPMTVLFSLHALLLASLHAAGRNLRIRHAGVQRRGAHTSTRSSELSRRVQLQKGVVKSLNHVLLAEQLDGELRALIHSTFPELPFHKSCANRQGSVLHAHLSGSKPKTPEDATARAEAAAEKCDSLLKPHFVNSSSTGHAGKRHG